MPSPEYEAARAAHAEAFEAYQAAAVAFRAGGSKEAFGLALEAKKAADAAFDAAWAAESQRPEPAAVEPAGAEQLQLEV